MKAILNNILLIISCLFISVSVWSQGADAMISDKILSTEKGIVDFAGKSLYIGVASKKRIDRVDIHLERVNHFFTEMYHKL